MTAKPEVEGTYLFGLEDSRRGYPLNKLCASLVRAEARDILESFLADETAYCDQFALTIEQHVVGHPRAGKGCQAQGSAW